MARFKEMRKCRVPPFKVVPGMKGNPTDPPGGSGGEYDTLMAILAALYEDDVPTPPVAPANPAANAQEQERLEQQMAVSAARAAQQYDRLLELMKYIDL